MPVNVRHTARSEHHRLSLEPLGLAVRRATRLHIRVHETPHGPNTQSSTAVADAVETRRRFLHVSPPHPHEVRQRPCETDAKTLRAEQRTKAIIHSLSTQTPPKLFCRDTIA